MVFLLRLSRIYFDACTIISICLVGIVICLLRLLLLLPLVLCGHRRCVRWVNAMGVWVCVFFIFQFFRYSYFPVLFSFQFSCCIYIMFSVYSLILFYVHPVVGFGRQMKRLTAQHSTTQNKTREKISVSVFFLFIYCSDVLLFSGNDDIYERNEWAKVWKWSRWKQWEINRWTWWERQNRPKTWRKYRAQWFNLKYLLSGYLYYISFVE